MKYLLIFTLTIFFSLDNQAQTKFKELINKKEVLSYYRIKDIKNDENRIVIKFKNKSDSHQNITLTLGLYLNGVMEEKSQIATCQKKGFFSNLFATQHAILNEQISEEQLNSESFSLEVIEYEIEQTENCEKTH